jgi:hypothetical protein
VLGAFGHDVGELVADQHRQFNDGFFVVKVTV